MYRERVSFGTYFILAILIPAAAEGQTPKDVRDGVVRVIASETELFGDLYLQVEVVPSYDVADGSMGVTLTSRGHLAKCTYRNPGPIYKGYLTNTLLSGQIDCFGGARFPLERLETVTADLWGSTLSSGVPLECRFDAEGTETGVTAVWECRLVWLEPDQPSPEPSQNWWIPRDSLPRGDG